MIDSDKLKSISKCYNCDTLNSNDETRVLYSLYYLLGFQWAPSLFFFLSTITLHWLFRHFLHNMTSRQTGVFSATTVSSVHIMLLTLQLLFSIVSFFGQIFPALTINYLEYVDRPIFLVSRFTSLLTLMPLHLFYGAWKVKKCSVI